ncbi:MAG: DEAD/DEAH box helicase [Planctomycetes bacterium]|nr:DEAD/DEAH box helicase [Planctomycetota bacterium]
MTQTDFPSLGLSEPILRALAARNYTTPTPIQARAIPHLLQGRDLLGIAQTGTGKTAAFALPMLQLMTAANRRPRSRCPRALVLAPTRELATQIAESFEAYGKHLHQRVAIVFGGVGQTPQVQALQRGIDVLVATPGRLLDLMQQRHCELGDLEILVLDEADRMLDMGFLPDVRRILQRIPAQRQSLLFSATMPADITQLAHSLLRDPVRVEVTPPAATADRIEQSVHFVKKDKKRDLLIELLQNPNFVRTLVFTRTKHGADRVARSLSKAGIEAHAIHGNKSQGARERALDGFREGSAAVLVATDIAARGIDVPEITHVINFDLPNIPESYVHRIGRTARAGRDGIAISFCDETEHEYLRDIEKLIRKRIPVVGQGQRSAPAGRQEPQRQDTPPRAPQPTARPARDDRGWAANVELEADADATTPPPREVPNRFRPEPRRAPGPYEPDPRQRKPRPHTPPQPRHERQRREGGRPAMPYAVDPESRRERDAQYAPKPAQDGRGQGGRGQGGPAHGGPSRGPKHGHGGRHGGNRRGARGSRG